MSEELSFINIRGMMACAHWLALGGIAILAPWLYLMPPSSFGFVFVYLGIGIIFTIMELFAWRRRSLTLHVLLCSGFLSFAWMQTSQHLHLGFAAVTQGMIATLSTFFALLALFKSRITRFCALDESEKSA